VYVVWESNRGLWGDIRREEMWGSDVHKMGLTLRFWFDCREV
jgi:hypothetical protein